MGIGVIFNNVLHDINRRIRENGFSKIINGRTKSIINVKGFQRWIIKGVNRDIGET
jgi:hypothetical protein